MKSVEKLILVIIALLILSWFGAFLKDIIVSYYFGGEELSLSQKETIRLISIVLASLVNIGASIWMYFESRKDKYKAWVWALFGLFFGLIAVAIYYLVNIYNRLKAESGATKFNNK